MASPIYYHRLKTTNRQVAGFTYSNTLHSYQGKTLKSSSLRQGLTVNEDLTDAVSVTATPGAGG